MRLAEWEIENIKNDPWAMLNNFRFHVYAQKSLFIAENCNPLIVENTNPLSAQNIESQKVRVET